MTKSIKFFDNGMSGRPFASNPGLLRSGKASTFFGEMTPLVHDNRLILVSAGFPWVSESPFRDPSLWIGDPQTGEIFSTFGKEYGFPSAITHNDSIYVFAGKTGFSSNGVLSIECFSTNNMARWTNKVVLHAEAGEEFFNQSVCFDGEKFTMAIEVRDKKLTPFSIYFAQSDDLIHWERVPAVLNIDRYTACPDILFSEGYYYLFYLEQRTPRWWFEMCVARSKDLVSWEESTKPVLQPEDAELCNSSDIDIVEFNNKVYVFYCYGNQKGMGCGTWAEYDGTLDDFLKYYFL